MLNVRSASWGAALFLYALLLVVPPAHAALGACGQPNSTGTKPLASDALEILRTAVGVASCGECNDCVCDVNSSGTVTASDALQVLRRAVGQGNTLECSCASGSGCGVSGVDQDCLSGGTCDEGLACDVTGYDFQTAEFTAATCHVRCVFDADCEPDEQCRPSTVGFYDVQRDGADKPVACVLGNSSPCDVAAGFECTRLAGGDRCAREFSACGTPVPMADRSGPDTVTEDMWCNSSQPAELPGVGTIGGSRFCDRLDSLASPPVTSECQQVDSTHPPGLGLCFARCEEDNGTLTDCPAGMNCSNDPDVSKFGTFLPDPTNMTYHVKQCVTAGDCGDVRYLCEEFSGKKFCYRHFGTCTYVAP